MEHNNLNYTPTTSSQTPQSTENKPTKKIIPFNKKDGIFAIIILLVSIFLVDSVMYSGYNLGFSIAMTILTIVCGIYCFAKSEKITPFPVFCLISAVAISISFAIFNDSFITFCGVVLILILIALGLLNISKQNSYEKDDERGLLDVVRFWFELPFRKVGTTMSSIFSAKGKKSNSNIGIIIASIFCAIPVAAIVFALLVSSDAAFEGFIEKVFSTGSATETIGSIIVGVIFFIFYFAIIFSVAKKEAKTAVSPAPTGSMPSVAVTSFLSVILGIYVLYMVSQLAYFFNAFLGILPENYSYSDYARRGFFEMCVICLINLALIILAISIVKKSDGNSIIPKSTKVVTTAIGAFSLLLTTTAISKMFLYMDEHGLTRKRIITSVFMVVMIIILAITILKIFIRKLPSIKIIITAVTVIGLLVCYVDIDTTVAKYNTEKYLAGEITTDAGYMRELSDSAVPYILKLAKSRTPLGNEARKELASRYITYFGLYGNEKDLSVDYQDYNYSKQNAKTLLQKNRGELDFKNRNDVYDW